ncbi:acyl-CoA dehydrogenase family protein [Nocardia sp. NPDC024068]|uniref:acyl-CoA dehydrogenase family protein n=1 Tax=Nocardia sp. NPDC024068 TaxID=3157197 RepID=UPI0033D95922
MNLTLPYPADLAAFAESIRRHAERHIPDDAWVPGATVSDHSTAMMSALTEAGWFDLVEENEAGNDYFGLGGLELGRAGAPYSCVAALLGGGVAASGLVLYGDEFPIAANVTTDGRLLHREVLRAHPVPYTDSLGVHVVDEFGPSQIVEAEHRVRAWRTATTGYIAGLALRSLELAVDHARNREAFGAPLATLDAVQIKLADAALTTESLRLCAIQGSGSAEELAYAAHAANQVAANAHQVLGAMGFTLEFELQRFTRRIRALSLLSMHWTAAIDGGTQGPQ